MELKINIDETKFGELLNEELDAFTKEELHEICRDGLIKCMSDTDTIKQLFVDKDTGYYGGYKANNLLEEAAKTINLSPLYEEFAEKSKQYIMENHKELLMDILTKVLIEGMGQYLYSTNFMSQVRAELYDSLRNQFNN